MLLLRAPLLSILTQMQPSRFTRSRPRALVLLSGVALMLAGCGHEQVDAGRRNRLASLESLAAEFAQLKAAVAPLLAK